MKAVRLILLGCLLPAAFGNIVDNLKYMGYTKLVELVEKADLVDALLKAEPLTLFAPKNEAFNGVPDIPIEDLRNLLLYHVIAGKAISTEVLLPVYRVDTASGSRLTINEYENGAITANGKALVKTNMRVGKNSIVHEIDEVIPFIESNDNLLLTLWKEGNFNTLITAVRAASRHKNNTKSGPIIDALANNRYTLSLVAPTDEAFDKLPKEELDNLLKPENQDNLIGLLKAHAVPEILYTAGIENGKDYQSMNEKESLSFDISDVGFFVSRKSSGASAKVVKPNIAATNGVVHAIDTLLL